MARLTSRLDDVYAEDMGCSARGEVAVVERRDDGAASACAYEASLASVKLRPTTRRDADVCCRPGQCPY